MSHRRNEYLERLQEHLDEREWTTEDKEHFLHMVGHSALLSTQSALSVLEFQQITDERIQAEKDFDETFVPGDGWGNGRGVIPQSFFEDSSEAIDPGFIQGRFEETL